MAEVYTRQLAAMRLNDGNEHLLGSAAAGSVIVLRDLVVTNTTVSAQFAGVFMRSPAGDIWVLLADPLAGRTSAHLDMRQEMPVGSSVYAQCGSGGVTVLLTGYVFSEP